MSEIQPHVPRPPAPAAYPAPPQQWHQPAVMTDQRQAGGAVVVIAWVSALATLGYMLPWAIAVSRGRSNMGAVGLVNLFLGWSLLGWIVAMVMACQAHAPVMTAAPVNVMVAQQFPGAQFAGPPPAPQGPVALVPAGWYTAPDGVGHQYWDGTSWTEHRAP